MAIAGGGSQGMEIWNPADGSVTLATFELPPEEGDIGGLDFSQMLPINNGTELLLYGGNQVGYNSGTQGLGTINLKGVIK